MVNVSDTGLDKFEIYFTFLCTFFYVTSQSLKLILLFAFCRACLLSFFRDLHHVLPEILPPI